MFCLETQMCRGEIDEGDWMKAINNREWWWWGKQNKWSLWSIIHYLGRVINILQCLRYCNIFRISENPIQRIYVFCEKVHAKNKAHWGWGCACCISTKIWVRISKTYISSDTGSMRLRRRSSYISSGGRTWVHTS